MSRDNESTMSSAVSISGLESFSDDGSTLSVGDKIAVKDDFGTGLFDLGDGDLYIKANDITLETHKFLIKRFAGLKDRIKSNTITLMPGEPGLEDFRNAFKVLYASVIEGPFDFDHTTLISALLLATRYDFPALRTFAINKLASAEMSPVERIRLAREFDIPSWEEPSFLALCKRDEPLAMPEAEVLGLETVLYVGVVREREQRRRREAADAIIAKEAAKGSAPKLDERPHPKPNPNPRANPKTSLRSNPNTQPASASELMSNTEPKPDGVSPVPKPSFVNAPELSAEQLYSYYSQPDYSDSDYSRSGYSRSGYSGNTIDVPVLDCDCKATRRGSSAPITCKCKLPPCAVSAFKHLQAQQLSHKSDISTLKTTVEHIQVAISSLKQTSERTKENPSASPNLSSPPSSLSSTSLQDDVKRWLVRQGAERRSDK